MSIDKQAIINHVRGILIALGDNPEREGLKDTPLRVANMFEEVFHGMNFTNDELAQMYDVTFEDDIAIDPKAKDMILMKDIDIISHCEHHLALMYNMKVAVAYIPKDRIIGLSKIARIADMVGRRLQLQERIGTDIAEIMEKVTGSKDIAVMIQGEHGCMTARGIKKPHAKTTTLALRGQFQTEPHVATTFLTLIKE